ncbi:hypothetical protein OF83DRAFT_661493 [Amylostereum chailletii]|nr:hypothetical protein OF83DRAFT_661493 [Amylostereum chailletii]
MSAPTPAHPPKPIIIQRSLSYSMADPSSSSRSSSLSSSDVATNSVHETNYKTRTVRSTCSLPTRPPSPLPNIKFAPLPTIEPRKRKSNVQLGVAARSRMIQQRRAAREENQNTPTWTQSDMEEPAVHEEPGPMDEDPFEVFGKYVIGKGRHLWRRVSHKEHSSPVVVVGKVDVVQELNSEKPQCTPLVPLQHSSVRHSRQGLDHDSLRSGSADHHLSEGGVWEDEIGEEMRRHLQKLAVASPAGNGEGKKDKRASIRTTKILTVRSS